MASCEKCWRDSRGHHRANAYSRLLEEREANGCVCTPEEQAGYRAKECRACGRMTMHIFCNVCMNPDCPSKSKVPAGKDNKSG